MNTDNIVYPGTYTTNLQVESAFDTSKHLFNETAFTVQYLMQKLQYLLDRQFIHKDDKIVFDKFGGNQLYYINDIVGTRYTKIKYDKIKGQLFMVFLNQQDK